MGFIAPVIAFVFIMLLFHNRFASRKTDTPWRSAILCSLVVTISVLFLLTELLSLLHWLTFWGLLASWLVTAAISVILYFKLRDPSVPLQLPSMPKLNRVEKTLLVLLAVVAVSAGAVALVCPSNNWDSAVYHMPSIFHWIQNQSLEFYPTHTQRQLHSNPGAEYVILNVQMLTRTDRYVNLVSWASMLASALVVSLIAKKLGAKTWGQILAAGFIITTPMGIGQATSTQVDFISGFWVAAFAYYVVAFLIHKSSLHFILAALSLGGAVLSKATAYPYAFPILAWIIFLAFRRWQWRAVAHLAVFGLLVVLLNLGHYARNYSLYGNVLGPCSENGGNKNTYRLESFAPQYIASNVLRNIGTHFNATLWRQADHKVYEAIVAIHEAAGVDVNDPKTTYGNTKFRVERYTFNDDVLANPLHLIFVTGCGIFLLFRWRSKASRNALIYGLVVLACFLMFCGYIKWNPWHSRLHQTMFILWAPVFGVVLGAGRRWIGAALSLVLIAYAVPYLLFTMQRPMVGQRSVFTTPRNELYFGVPQYVRAEPYLEAQAYIREKGFSRIGFPGVGMRGWEQSVMVLTLQDNPDTTFGHVNVNNESKALYERPKFGNFSPDVLVSLDRELGETIPVKEREFTRTWQNGFISIYEPKSD